MLNFPAENYLQYMSDVMTSIVAGHRTMDGQDSLSEFNKYGSDDEAP